MSDGLLLLMGAGIGVLIVFGFGYPLWRWAVDEIKKALRRLE